MSVSASETACRLIIPAYNEAATLRACLDSVRSSPLPDGYSWTGWVVLTSGSDDGTAEIADGWAAEHPSIPLEVVRSPHRMSKAANLAGVHSEAVRSCRHGELLIVLDADATVTSGAIRALVGQFDRQPDLAVAFGMTQIGAVTTRRWPSAFQMEVNRHLVRRMDQTEPRAFGVFFAYRVGALSGFSWNPSLIADDVQLAEFLRRSRLPVTTAHAAAVQITPAGSIRDFYRQTYRSFAAQRELDGPGLPFRLRLTATVSTIADHPLWATAYGWARLFCAIEHRLRPEPVSGHWSPAATTKSETASQQGRPTGLSGAMVTFGPLSVPTHGIARRARAVAEDLTYNGVAIRALAVGEPVDTTIPAGRQAVAVRSFSGFPRTRVSRELIRAISSMAKGSDFVLIESAQFLPAVLAARTKVPLIWDTTECETLHYRRRPPTISNRSKQIVWWLLERWSVAASDVVVAVSTTEAQWWQRLFPTSVAKCMVVDHRPLETTVESGSSESEAEKSSKRLVFLGNTVSKHNRDAAIWIRDVLAAQLPPEVEICLIGPGTEAFGRGSVCGLGLVTDFEPLLRSSGLGLAPLGAGAGVKTKVLDYVAAGLRVVGTPTAFEGIEECPGLVSASLDDFPNVIRALLAADERPDERADRRAAQAAYLSVRHGAGHTRRQWGEVLRMVGLEPRPHPMASST